MNHPVNPPSEATSRSIDSASATDSATPTGSSEAAGKFGRVDSWLDARPRLAWALSAVLAFVVAAIVVVPAATAPGGMSPIDEYDYTDALDKADRGELSNTGDKTGQYARQVMSCRGVIAVAPPAPDACGVPLVDTAVPREGFSAADIHPPTYFFLTAAVGKVIRAVGLTDDLLLAGRLAGVLWLALGMLALLALGRMWGAGWLMPWAASAAIASSPLLVSVSGYLSPDALALLVGAGVVMAATYWLRGRLPAWALFLVAVTPAFVKVPFVLAPVFAALLLLVASLLGQTAWRRSVIGAVILVGGAGCGAVAWQLLRGALKVADPVVHPDGPSVAVEEFARYLGYYLQQIPVHSGAPLPVTITLSVAIQPLAWLLVGAAMGGILLRRREDPLLPVAWAGMASMALGSIVLSVIVLLATGGFLIGTPRYGLALLPLFAVPLMSTRHPAAVVLMLVSASASVLSHLLLW